MWTGSLQRHFKAKPFGIRWRGELIGALGVYLTYHQKPRKETNFFKRPGTIKKKYKLHLVV